MVRKILFLILLCLLPVKAYAAEFTAAVDNNHVTAEGGFTLQLTLSGAEAQDAPDVSALKRLFRIVGQSQTQNMSYVNGTVNMELGWSLTLVPKKGGQQTIPPVTINTSKGFLSTAPINIEVVEKAPEPPSQQTGEDRNVTITATVDSQDIYQNQAIHYSVKIIHRSPIYNINLSDVVVDGAIVDKPDKPKIYNDVENGHRVRVIELDYIITPLRSGRISIPPFRLQGQIESGGPEIFGAQDMADPMMMMRALSGLGMMKPFSVSGNGVDIDVKAPVATMTPWLPLYSLQIKDEWPGANGTAKVGEPLTREIMILADGATGGQLPSLEDKQNHADFKVYADKATTGTEKGQAGEHISGWRRESYSLIPKKAGTITIPAVKIAWWDIHRNQVSYAELPERVVEVAPGAEPVQPASVPSAAETQPSTDDGGRQIVDALPQNPPIVLYGIIGLLVSGLLLIAFWAWRLQRKISGLEKTDVGENRPNDTTAFIAAPEGSESLERIKTPQELKRYIQAYAARHWGASANLPLEQISSAAPAPVKKDAAIVAKTLTAALYGGKNVDMEMLKKRVANFRPSSAGKKSAEKPFEKLGDLNPS